MKILITTDLEGVSGIVEWDRHDRGTPLDLWQRKLMTGEVNAAIEGAFDAGATRVKVAEGHNAIDILQMDRRASIVPAIWPAIPPLQGWDEGFNALIQIGHHAMAGTKNGLLAHSYNHRTVEYIEINGMRIGEIGVEAAQAGDYGFPTVLISGDEAACREAQDLLGDIEVAAVKKGYGCHHADCLHPAKARELIREKARAALNRLDEFKPFIIPGPIKIIECYFKPLDEQTLKAKKEMPETEIIDERTLAYHGRNVVEAMARRCGVDCSWTAEKIKSG
ncbi:M55 family metallopeptidase [candidate division KSB1 bacterium]|nr:M55 family metallopeptidase [candidate division KSB1 bacterium]